MLRNLKYIIPALIVFALFFSWHHNNSKRISEALDGPHVKINKTIIAVDVADSPGEQYRGLSGRPLLDKNRGMLFVFQSAVRRSFVMREMNFPLDIIWIADGKIIKIDENLPPEGKKPENAYSSGTEVSYAMEVNGGFVKKKKIKTGDEVEINL